MLPTMPSLSMFMFPRHGVVVRRGKTLTPRAVVGLEPLLLFGSDKTVSLWWWKEEAGATTKMSW